MRKAGGCGDCRLCMGYMKPKETVRMTKTNSEPTTALESLGTFLYNVENDRDAVHLAVVRVTAPMRLYPGQHVAKDGTPNGDLIGIVDPFLPGPVNPEQQFWLVLYPRTITSLRHVWEHPAFEEKAETAPPVNDDKELSRAYLEDFAKRLFSYYQPDEYDSRSQLQTLLDGIEHGGAFGTDIEYGDDVQPSDELYRHFAIYTGKSVPKAEYFRCAC